MTHTILTGNDDVSREEAEATSRHYTPGPQEDIEEMPEEVDRSPITDAQRKSLDEATADSFRPITGDQQNGDRAATFVVPGEWESPVVKHRRKQAMILPNVGSIADLEQRIGAVLHYGGAPQQVTELGQKARIAVSAARKAHEGARHADNPRYAVNQGAKDTVILEIAQATSAVAALEALARDEAVKNQWFDSLVEELPAQREEAARALETAAKTYSAWRQSIDAADALAREQGRWGEWHLHPDRLTLKPNALIDEIRKARDIAKSDDAWVNGDYLTAECEGIPEWTMRALEKSAQRAPGSFAEMTFHRLKSPHAADGPARDTIAQRDLRIINTSPVPVLAPDRQRD